MRRFPLFRIAPAEADRRLVVVRLLIIGLTVVGLTVMGGGDALGCPNCKDAVNTSDPEGLDLARGYFYSILLMLAMPFTLAGTFGCYVWREMRRQQREQAAASDHGPVES